MIRVQTKFGNDFLTLMLFLLSSLRRALCYYFSRDLGFDHLTAHAQSIDALTRSQLEDYLAILSSVFSRWQALPVSPDISEEAFVQMEQRRRQAYPEIDQLAGKQCEENREKVDDYRQTFDRLLRNEPLERING